MVRDTIFGSAVRPDFQPSVNEPAPRNPAPSGLSAEEEGTGLPGLRTWPALYVFVVLVFVFWVALLCALTWMFS
jgi:hypothetical protein